MRILVWLSRYTGKALLFSRKRRENETLGLIQIQGESRRLRWMRKY